MFIQVKTCGFGVVLRSAGPSLPVMNGILVTHSSLSLLSCEKLPAAICFVFRPAVWWAPFVRTLLKSTRCRAFPSPGPGSLLHGPVKLRFMPSCRVHAGGVLGKLASAWSFCAPYLRWVSLLCLYYTTPAGRCLFAKPPTFYGNICT